jgi:hypothetical protein
MKTTIKFVLVGCLALASVLVVGSPLSLKGIGAQGQDVVNGVRLNCNGPVQANVLGQLTLDGNPIAATTFALSCAGGNVQRTFSSPQVANGVEIAYIVAPAGMSASSVSSNRFNKNRRYPLLPLQAQAPGNAAAPINSRQSGGEASVEFF